MLVRLTHTQADQIQRRMPELYGSAMREHRTTAGRTQHDYDLPAIAWRQIFDAMVAACFGPKGGILKGRGRPADSAYVAIRRVANAVRLIEGHPAMRGARIEGWTGDIIPAWGPPHSPGGIGSRDYSPYLAKPWPFVLLVPQHVTNLGMRVTYWLPEGSEATPASLMRWQDIEGCSWTWRAETHELFQPRPSC